MATRARSVTFPLPLPPSNNGLYAVARGRLIKSKAAREYQSLVGERVLADDALRGLTFRGPLQLEVTLFLARDRDVDGVKALQDSLAAAFGFDDRIIARLVVEKCVGRVPGCVVTLTEWEAA